MTPWQFVQSRIINLWLAFKVLVRPVLFVFIFNAMPNSADAYSTFLIDTYDTFEVNATGVITDAHYHCLDQHRTGSTVCSSSSASLAHWQASWFTGARCSC